MRSRVVVACSVLGSCLFGVGCPGRSPDELGPPHPPTATQASALAPATTPEPAAAPAPPAPFDWATTVADGEHHLAVAVGQRAKRFAPTGSGGQATPEVVLQADPPVRARAVYRESGCDSEGDDCQGRWSLEITAGKERWQIVDLATWTTDCAAIEDGFGREGIALEARDLVPGGPQELVIVGSESHAAYLDDCDCTTRGGGSEHLWVCGLVPEGASWRPVCWAHVETRRSVGPTMDPADCACSAGVPSEAWGVEAELVPPGVLRVTHDGRIDEHELATLPCTLTTPPAAFACEPKAAGS